MVRDSRCYLLLDTIKRPSPWFSKFGRIVPLVSKYPLPARFFRISGLGKVSPQILQSKWLMRNLNIHDDLYPQIA